jgi:hypothetical protein
MFLTGPVADMPVVAFVDVLYGGSAAVAADVEHVV